jgi:two-component system, chemotaxis family, sensor kinase CheA
MTDTAAGGEFADFRASFLAEAEEHLQVIEHSVLELDVDLQSGEPDPRRLRELFRAAHTIKALAAMLEFEPLVELSHRLESILRALERHTLPFTQAVVDGLVDGSKALSSLVEDIRAERELQFPASLLQRLDSLANLAAPPTPPQPSDDALTDYEQNQIESALASGKQVYEVRFIPTAEAVERGVSINSVREALERLGQVVRIRPEMAPESGGIAFLILVITNEPVSAAAARTGLDEGQFRVVTREVPAAQPPRPADPAAPRSSVVRVEISRLDELMRLLGELVITRARIGRAAAELERGLRRDTVYSLQEGSLQMERQLRSLREAIMRVRIVHVREAFGRMPLAIRDSARAAGKQVRLEMTGEETEVDKMLVDRLVDPLTHLVRNAVDHGIELPAQRRARGKPEEGTVRISAGQSGDWIVIQVSDDGRGIDRDRVAEKAASLGFSPEEIRESDDALLRALCHPGLSTREQAGRTSGRGVGMDIVRQRVREMNGDLDLSTKPGSGSTFTLRLPLTLLIVEALIARSGGQRFAIPISTVEEVAEIARDGIVSFNGSRIVQHRGEVLQLLHLNQVFHLQEERSDRPYHHALVVIVGGVRWAVTLDQMVGEQEVVVKTLSDVLARTPGVIGATDLGDGELALILDIPELVRHYREGHNRAAEPEEDRNARRG